MGEDRVLEKVEDITEEHITEDPAEEPAVNPEDETVSAGDPVEVNAGDVKARAKQKLQEELKKADNKDFADPVIQYLLRRCEEDSGLSEDVVQEHKTWTGCFNYIYGQARKQATGNRCAVRDDVVYEWAEDYYHKDDKAEKQKKPDAARKNVKPVMPKAQKKQETKPARKKDVKEPKKQEAKPKIAKKPGEIEGQMDFFSLMGM